jgi:uncharacterized protein (TIGR03083 family)
MSSGAEEAITALRRSHDELVELVGGLGTEDLAKLSGSSEWTVAQVLSHLGSAAEIGLNTLETGQADMAAAQGVWARWNAMSPTEQASGFVVASEAQVRAFEALDETERAERQVDVGFLPAPVDIEFLAGMRLSEVGLHRWDIDVVSDPAAVVAGYLAPILLKNLPVFARFFARPIGRTGRVALSTSEPALSYVLELTEAGGSLEEGSADDATTTVRLPAESLLRLTSGRLAPGHTPASVEVEGELTLDDLRRVFPGY